MNELSMQNSGKRSQKLKCRKRWKIRNKESEIQASEKEIWEMRMKKNTE